MITYKEYLKTIHKEIPKVHFGISDRNFLTEELHSEGHIDYIGPEETSPENLGYSRTYSSIYSHPDHPDTFFTFVNSAVKAHKSLQDAHDHEMLQKRKSIELEDSISDKLASHYSQSNYDMATHRHALSMYTGTQMQINDRLLKNTILEPHQSILANLDSALNKVKTPESLVVYTGTDNNHSKVLRDHEIVHHPAYLSTSIDKTIATSFAKAKLGDVIKIHVPEGHPGLYAMNMSSYPHEREFVLPRNMKLKIDHSKRQVMNVEFAKHKIYLHHAYPVQE